MLDINAFRKINQIIEYDSTSSTYKFALLKNVIEVCQKYDHTIKIEKDKDKVKMPLGLIVEGWIFDYLPFVFEGIRQQQTYGKILNKPLEKAYNELFQSFSLNKNILTWQEAYRTVRQAYEYLDLNNAQSKAFLKLAKESAKTITQMPMKYIGSEEYEIFKPLCKNFGSIRLKQGENFDRSFLIENFSYFETQESFFKIFRYIGQSLFGISTIAKRWKEKTCKINPLLCMEENTVEKMIFNIFSLPRDTIFARSLLPNRLRCVWSGKPLKKEESEIDHILPYSIWQNNDLWNLMPASRLVNNKKRDKIPSPHLIEKRKKMIIYYWKCYLKKSSQLFQNQIETSLGCNVNNLQFCIGKLSQKAKYLINDRGYQPYDGPKI